MIATSLEEILTAFDLFYSIPAHGFRPARGLRIQRSPALFNAGLRKVLAEDALRLTILRNLNSVTVALSLTIRHVLYDLITEMSIPGIVVAKINI